jgi:hypothetical protein
MLRCADGGTPSSTPKTKDLRAVTPELTPLLAIKFSENMGTSNPEVPKSTHVSTFLKANQLRIGTAHAGLKSSISLAEC